MLRDHHAALRPRRRRTRQRLDKVVSHVIEVHDVDVELAIQCLRLGWRVIVRHRQHTIATMCFGSYFAAFYGGGGMEEDPRDGRRRALAGDRHQTADPRASTVRDGASRKRDRRGRRISIQTPHNRYRVPLCRDHSNDPGSCTPRRRTPVHERLHVLISDLVELRLHRRSTPCVIPPRTSNWPRPNPRLRHAERLNRAQSEEPVTAVAPVDWSSRPSS